MSTLWWLRYPFLTIFLALIVWFAYVLIRPNRERQMAVISRQNCAGQTDPGAKRENNEDRFHADPDRGIFFVIDGVGGQAAGEKAADTAYNLLRARLERPTGTPADRVREAITIANNEIFRLSESNEAWRGMACVLTVVVVEDGQITVGQVGDSRLYLSNPAIFASSRTITLL